MAQPVLDSFAADVYSALAPVADLDALNQYALAYYVATIGRMFQIVEDYGRDTSEGPGWSQAVDITRCPTGGIPWLGQFVGATVDTSQSDAEQRFQVQNNQGWQRGTPASIAAAASRFLTGTKSVILTERLGGDAWALGVDTITSETPDSVAVYESMLTVKPAGIVITYNQLTQQTFDSILTTYTPFSTLFADFATFGGVLTGIPGT